MQGWKRSKSAAHTFRSCELRGVREAPVLPEIRMESNPRTTMQQIADKAGVSRMAVSLALRGSKKVSARTTARIREVAEELGYRPNPLISALMTHLRQTRPSAQQTTIAYATAFPTNDEWRKSAHFVRFFEGARRRAEALGYVLEEWWLRPPGMTEQRISEILFNRDIHGLLVAPLPIEIGDLHLDWPKLSCATIGYSLRDTALHRVSNDQYGSMQLALRELTRLGYHRIGLVVPREEDLRVEQRWSAAMLAYQSGLAPEDRIPLQIADAPFGAEFVEWFRTHRPDAVLSTSGECLTLLNDLEVRVPKDVGFAHLGITPGENAAAGVDQRSELVGSAALDLVDTLLRSNERGLPILRRSILISGVWVPGRTVSERTATRRR